MGDTRTQQEKLHDKHGGLGTDPSRDASKQGTTGQPKWLHTITRWFA